MSENKDTCYLIVVPSDYDLNGWTKNLFLAREYIQSRAIYRTLPIKFMTFSSETQMREFFKEHEEEWSLPRNMTEKEWDYKIDTYLIMCLSSTKTIGSGAKYAVTTYHYYDIIESDGYFDNLMYDTTMFAYVMDTLERKFLPFIQKEFRKKIQQDITILVNYSRLITLREEFDCEQHHTNGDICSKDFLKVREAFLNETELDLVYELDEEGDFWYNGVIDEIAWLIINGML